MIHLRTLDGTTEDMLDPAFRKIQFDDEAAIVLVSTHLRHAWTARPPAADADAGTADVDLAPALAAFIRASHARSDEERKAVPQEPDAKSVEGVHTKWRDEVHYHWNHVFWDVAGFVGELACTGVHMHPPAHGVFPVDYRGGADILVIPAYLAPGVSVRCARRVVEGVEGAGEAGEGEKVLGTFDGTNVYEIWYVRRNTEVVFQIDGTAGASGDVAAVMVYGMLCRDVHGAKGDEEEEK
ncbi:hypothetical protein BJ912DRAFT_1008179 [Pholiota molesta]|nr:hypothetical protein BJ912DRAFT_1008179 [Pholiota molesta]